MTVTTTGPCALCATVLAGRHHPAAGHRPVRGAVHALVGGRVPRDVLLPAKSWQEHHHFNWFHIVSNHNELCLAFFDQIGDVIQAKLEDGWLASLFLVLGPLVLSFLLQSLFLFLFPIEYG